MVCPEPDQGRAGSRLIAMDRDALHRLATACGLQVRHTGPDGEVRVATEAAVRGMLAAMKVDATSDAAIARSLASAPPLVDPAIEVPRVARCHLPSWLISKPAWGVTCQLYGLRSGRNHGIGDFEDLAVLAERLAPEGADFIGINPIHALFTADPDRCSPFSPSNRKFLNPLFIALDRVPGIDASFASGNLQRRPSSSGHINYRAVARFKLRVLRDIWKRIGADSRLWAASDRKAFEAFVAAEGEALRRHAVFEALSHVQTRRGRGAGWHGWPPSLRRADTEEVARFAAENEQDVRFHLWLQWVADRQVADAAARACAAGMRFGLYLDLAVGAAPDGSATWSDPDLVMTGATIGAPPDGFFTGGQNWGLAPMSPLTLRSRRLKPYREMLARAARHAGAVRLDHAMGLHRLFLIPSGMSAADGCYALYPMDRMVRALADVSKSNRTIVIGEDLGTVPKGFSKTIQAAGMLSSVVLYFQRHARGYRTSATYPKNALVSVSTHDLPPFGGWWGGDDIALFRKIGLLDAKAAAARREERAADREALLVRLRRDLPRRSCPASIVQKGGKGKPPPAGPVSAAVHAFLARTPSILCAVQYEDLCGADAPVNIPGTWDEYPNWRIRANRTIEQAAASDRWREILAAVARERPK